MHGKIALHLQLFRVQISRGSGSFARYNTLQNASFTRTSRRDPRALLSLQFPR